MRKNRNTRSIIVSILCVAVLFMGVGYASFQEELNVTGTASAGGNWNVHFNSITAMIPEGSAAVSNRSLLDATKKVATFDASLNQPGDQVVYTVGIVNEGNIDAIVESIEVKETNVNNEEVSTFIPISYIVDGLTEGATIPSGEKATFTVTVNYDDNDIDSTVTVQKNISVTVHYKQRTK